MGVLVFVGTGRGCGLVADSYVLNGKRGWLVIKEVCGVNLHLNFEYAVGSL